MTSNHLFLSCLVIIGVGLSNSCNQYKTKPMSKQDSVNVQVAVKLDKIIRRIDSLENRPNASVRFDLQARQMDSLRTWVYEVEKDGRVAEYHQRQDYQRIITKLDSIGRREPRLRTICKAIGDLAGSMLGLNQVGKVLGL